MAVRNLRVAACPGTSMLAWTSGEEFWETMII